MSDKYNVDVDNLTFEMTKKLKFYLAKLVEFGGSDLHIKSGSNICARINGQIVPLSKEVLSYEDSLLLAKELLRTRFSSLIEKKNLDFTYKLDEHYGFRANIFFQINGVSAVFRAIPTKLPTLESLRIPSVVKQFSGLNRGLVLLTGPTGSGKTTTLAAMINHINQNHQKHIITIEDPVEFVYKDDKSIINQRAIGQDALSFSDTLRASLREDPDVILVGEMRDLETIETAMLAAETGHLVLSTVHSLDAKETINRIQGMFSVAEQNRIKMSLASTLKGVVSQRLVRTVDGKRTVAVEILVNNSRISNLILEGRDDEITDAIKEGKDIYKCQTFDQSLLDLYAKGRISKEEALQNATSKNDLALDLNYFDANKAKQNNIKLDDEVDVIGLKK